MNGNPDDGIFAGTFLDELMEILAKGEFVEPKYPVAEGEEIIGEMTPLDKALRHLMNAKGEKINRICEDCGHTEDDQKSDKCRDRYILKRQFDALEELRWALIIARLNVAGTIGIRQNYKIVKVPEEETKPSPDGALLIIGSTFRS